VTDFRWRIEYWDPATATWNLDGNESLATGIASRFDGTAEDLAERLLRNWTDEPGTADGRWRATIWRYDPARPPGDPAATKETTRPVIIAFSQLPHFERAAPDGRPATMMFHWPGDLLAGDVIEGLRDPWAVVAHVNRSGPDVTIRVGEAGGSRTMALGARKPNLGVRSDLRVDPSTIPDIPDGFPPRWGVWRNGPLHSGTLAWYPEPGEAAEHARLASRDGREYVVELEATDGTWTQVDAYQQGRRSAWGTQLAAGLGRTVVPPWATPGKDGTADRATARLNAPAGRDVPAGRMSAPGLAGSSFPAPARTGPSAAPPGPAAPRAQQNPPDQAQGRRR